MSHSLPPRSERSSKAPDLPSPLEAALESVRKRNDDLEAWDTLEEACREYDRPDEAAALFTEILETDIEGEVLEELGRRAADFCEEWYEDTGPVLEMLTLVLTKDPSQEWAFERLTVLLTVSADWDSLLGAYDSALSVTEDDKRRGALLEEAAKVARDFAAEPERASDYMKALLLLRLDDEQLASGLERRFDEQNRHEDLIEIWTARLSVMAKESAIRTRLQIAVRFLDALGDGERAFLSVNEYLEAGGDEGEACSLLERLANTSAVAADVRRPVLKLLEEIYEKRGESEKVISAVERALLLAESDKDRVHLHERAAALLSLADSLEGALSHWASILKLEPAHESAQGKARELAERTGQLPTYVAALVAAAETCAEGPRRIELLIDAARTERNQLSNAGAATDLYYQIEGDPEADAAARLLACQELSVLLLEAERSEDLLVILEKRAELEGKADERARVLGEAARLATDLGQGERALGLWSLRLNDNEKDLEALSAKVELFSELSKFKGLVDALRARAEVDSDPARQRDDLVRAATVHAERLGDLKSAISVWRVVEDQFGRVDESLDALVSLSAQDENYEQVVELLAEAIEPEQNLERRVLQLGRLGDTYRLHLQQKAEALESYEKCLELDPLSEVARAGLRALTLDPKYAHPAAEALADAFRSSDDPAALIDLVELRIGAAPDDEFRALVLLEAAELQEAEGDLGGALGVLVRAFALTPESKIETELHRLAELSSDWGAVTDAYTQALAGLKATERAGSLFLSRGRIEEERLSRPDLATVSYRSALERSPTQLNVARSLVRVAHRAGLYGDAAWALVETCRALDSVSVDQLQHFAECAAEHQNWDGALEGLADKIAGVDGLSPLVAHDLKKQLAVWYRDMLQDPDSAEMVLKRAAADYPQEDSLRILADLQRRAPGKPLVLTLVALADVCSDEMGILREAGEVALSTQEDELSLPILERALKAATLAFEDSGSVETESGFAASDVAAWATDHLVELALRQERGADAVGLLERSSELPFPAGEKVARKFRAAQVAFEQSLEKKAISLCETVLKAEGEHEGAITLLSEIHEKAGRLDELLSLRKRELALGRPLARRLFLRLDQVRVLGETGADLEQRAAILNENLADEPGHERSVDALSEILSAGEEYSDLARMLEEQARAIVTADPERASLMWYRAGQIAATHLKDEARLESDFKLSAAAHPSVPVLDRLAQMAAADERPESEVSWLTQLLALLPEVSEEPEDAPLTRREVVLRLGRAMVQNEDRNAARTLVEVELSKDPPADGARQLLAQIYRDLEEWNALSTLQVEGVKYAPDDATRIEYLRSAAQVERKRLGNLEAAVPLLQQAMELDPQERGIKLQLSDTLREVGRFEEAAEILTDLLTEFGRRRTREKAVVHAQLARIARASGQLDEALEHAEAAAKIERTDATILMLVGQLAKEKGRLDQAEQAYRTLALIASRTTPKGESSADDVEADEVGESAILFELYRISEERGDAKQSRELLDSALEVATRDPVEALRLAGALRASGQDGLLIDALDERLASGLEGTLASRLLVTKANVLEQSGREREALSARLMALSHTPGDHLLIDATRKLADRAELSAEFWNHIVRLAEENQSQASVSGELWYRAGLYAEEELGDRAKAADYFEISQKSDHKPKRAFLALDRVLDEGSSPERVRSALSRYVASKGADESPDTLSDALYRLADFELATDQVEAGAAHLMQALEVAADEERALSMLEPVVRAGSATERVIILFLRVCRKAASKETLLYAFRKAASTQTVERSVLSEAVEHARALDDGEALRELLTRTIEVSVEAGEVEEMGGLVVERATLAQADQQWERELSLLTLASPLFDGEDRFELDLRRATCLSEHLGRVEEGTQLLEGLLEQSPEEGRVWRRLLAIYRNAGRVSDVEDLISKVEESATDESDLEALKMERIRLMVGEERFEEAEEQLRQVLSERPHLTEAAGILADLLRKAERWDELRELVEGLLSRARERGDAALVSRFGMELAQLVMATERAEAISVLTEGLPLAKGDREYVSFLLDLYGEDDNQSERADVMEHLLLLEEGEAAREQAFSLYALRSELGDDYGAGRALELGVKRAPRDQALLEQYIAYLRQGDDFARLSEALLIHAAQAEGEAAGIRYAEAAQIFDQHLGDPEGAASAMARAYKADPANLAYLEQGAQYLVAVGRAKDAIEQLSVAIDSGEEVALADLLELRATIIRKELSSDKQAMSQAAEDISRALEQLIPEEQEESLERARIEVLIDLRGLSQSDGDEEGERAVTLKLAEIYIGSGDSAAGIDTLASWVRDHDEDVVVCEILGSTATQQGDHFSAMFAYQRLVEVLSGQARVEAVLLLTDAARAAGNPLDARAALEQVFEEDPTNEAVLSKLREMYEAAGAYQELAVMLLSEAEKTQDTSARSELYLQAGDLYLAAAEPEVAIGVYEQALEIAESPYLLTAKLADCYLAVGDTARAEEVLNHAVESHGKRRTPELAVLQQGLARVAQAQGNQDGMFAWLEAALMSDRNNGDVARDLAVLGQEEGRYDIAVKALQSLTLSKVAGPMSKAEAYLRQAQIAQIQGDEKKALLMARRAQATDPEQAGLSYLLSQLGG